MAYYGGQIVMPEQPPEKTVVESVCQFLQSSGGYAQMDTHDRVTFVDVQHIRLVTDQPLVTTVFIGYSNGYQIWVLAGESGAAHELISVRNGKHTYSIRLLATPRRGNLASVDRFADKRPLIAVCCDDVSADRQDSERGVQKRSSAKSVNGSATKLVAKSVARVVEIVSLRTGEHLEKLALATEDPYTLLDSILANERWVITVHGGSINVNGAGSSVGSANPTSAAQSSLSCLVSVFDAGSLRPILQLRIGAAPSAVTIGDRWIAFGERRLRQALVSCGGVANGSASGSYITAALDVTKTLFRGFTMLSETVAKMAKSQPQSVPAANGKSPVTQVANTASSGGAHQQAASFGNEAASNNLDAQSTRFGVVSVVDLAKLAAIMASHQRDGNHSSGNLVLDMVNNLSPNCPSSVLIALSTVAHFVAHADEAIQSVAFDATGSLLLTASTSGRSFNVFSIHSAVSASQRAAVHHLYTLRRGHTECLLQNVAFTSDSRFVTVTSQRGTVHLFAIAPYGGMPTMRTHATPRVVNRTSKFQRSAGLDELPPSGLMPSSSPHATNLFGTASAPAQANIATVGDELLTPVVRVSSFLNPRRPPFPPPVELNSVAQVRRSLAPFNINLADAPSGTATTSDVQIEPIAIVFGAPAADENVAPAGLASSTTFRALSVTPSVSCAPCCVDLLLAMNGATGLLTQYEVLIEAASRDQRTSGPSGDTPISVKLSQRFVWPLRRSATSAAVTPGAAVSSILGISSASAPRSVSSSSLSSSGFGSGPMNKRSSATTSLSDDDEWMAQVEIVTYNGPHRRLWMGPQFTFCKCTNESLHQIDRPSLAPSAFSFDCGQPLDSLVPLVSTSSSVLQTLSERDMLSHANYSAIRSSPIAISGSERRHRSSGTVLIEACSIGSVGSIPTSSLGIGGYEPVEASFEQEEAMRTGAGDLDDSRIRESIEDALLEPSTNFETKMKGLTIVQAPRSVFPRPAISVGATRSCIEPANSIDTPPAIPNKTIVETFDLGLEPITATGLNSATELAIEPSKTSCSDEAERSVSCLNVVSDGLSNGGGSGNGNSNDNGNGNGNGDGNHNRNGDDNSNVVIDNGNADGGNSVNGNGSSGSSKSKGNGNSRRNGKQKRAAAAAALGSRTNASP